MFQKLKVIEQHPTFIVINKRAGIITERNPFEKITAESLVDEYLSSGKRTPFSLDQIKNDPKKRTNFKKNIGQNKSFVGVVHRLDRVSSGCLLFAKNKSSLKYFNELIAKRKIKKTYLALVHNKPNKESGVIRNYLVKDQKSKSARIYDQAVENGMESTLSYELIHSNKFAHLLKIQLDTGRFHQIRAQLGHIGCPIIGDEKYGSNIPFLPLAICLHAYKLNFRLKNGDEFELKADLPNTRYWKDFVHHL